MNIKVHTSAVLATCTLGGLLLGWVLVDRYREVDVGLVEAGPTSVTLRNAELLTDFTGQWLYVNDLVLQKGESHMVPVSMRNAKRLRQLMDDVARSPLAHDQTDSIRGLERHVSAIEAMIFESREHSGPDRKEQLDRIVAEVRPIANALVQSVEELQTGLELRAGHIESDLMEQQARLSVYALLAAILYGGLVWLCWLWTVHRVVVPIESLSDAAGKADHEEGDFVLPQTGPQEVRQLTSNISNFITKLQEAKAGTEEEVVQRTAELVQANKAKAQFLATMSHELRTPLNGIINMNELILETELDAEQGGFATTAKNAAEALLALINDILDFSKIEARKLSLECVEFDLRSVVDSAIEILAGVAESKGLELQAVVSADVPTRVEGDPTRLRQVLINLLNNALKFTSEGSVSAHVGVVRIEGDGVVLRTEVRDTGIGIPEERRASLFQAFEQVDSSTTRKYGGTGLGLAICRELVSLMDGEIDVESVVGEGSTFWFRVSLGVVEEVEAPVPVNLDQDGVLVVSQRPIFADRVVQQLRFLGLPESAVAVVRSLDAVARPEGSRCVLVDPYGRGTEAFADAWVALDCEWVQQDRIAVVDHWLRHWPSEMGAVPSSVCKLPEPTSFTALRSWIQGELARSTGDPSSEVEASAPATPSDKVEANKTKVAANRQLSLPKVLVVEDAPVNRRVARAILERSGYEVDEAENGKIAVEMFADFDLILMDCQMPEMDGLEATRQIRLLEIERSPSSGLPKHVPIIALTANTQEGAEAECLAAGMTRFMAKPYRAMELVEAVADGLVDGASCNAAKARVLVADDDAINRKVAQSVLRRTGFEIVFAEHGRQAVDLLMEVACDLVLMDCQMPVLDGLAASRLIRDLEASGELAEGMPDRVPIVALTGNVLDADHEAARDAGMDEVVTKPFRPRDLLEVVTRLVSVS